MDKPHKQSKPKRAWIIVPFVAILLGLATLGTWYTQIRPQSIRKACAAQTKDISNYRTHVSNKAVGQYLDSALMYGTDSVDAHDSWNNIEDTTRTSYTGEYDKAYSNCLHQKGL